MNDQYEKWKDKYFTSYPTTGSIYSDITRLEMAYNELVDATKEKRFGCHIAAHRGDKIFVYAFCMYDAGYDCTWSTSKDGCDFWKEIEV